MKVSNKILLRDLNHLLRAKFTDDIKDVVLFGSQIGTSANVDSDYDILVVMKEKADWEAERAISDICYELDLKYNIITDTHIIGESELSSLRGKQPIYINALANGLRV